MPEEEIKALLQRNIELSEKICAEMEKQKKIRLWTLIISIAVIVLPLVAAVIMLPWMVSTIQKYYGGALNI